VPSSTRPSPRMTLTPSTGTRFSGVLRDSSSLLNLELIDGAGTTHPRACRTAQTLTSPA
jgi:hypothetical protein